MPNKTSRVVFVSGASSGIGRASAIHFAREGGRVACIARDRAKLESLVSEIRGFGGEAALFVADVTVESQVSAAVEGCVKAFGGIDVCIPAAGIIASGSLESISMADFDSMMLVNVRSVVHTLKTCIPHLSKRPGCVVTISSTTGYRAFPNVFAYCLSKAAIEQATRCLALELAPKGIRVNCIAPGVIVTELHRRGGMDAAAYEAFLERGKQTHPLGHVGEVADAVNAISFLAGDGAKWLTGIVVPVDGGRGITCLR